MNVGNALKVLCVGFGAGVVLRVVQMLYFYDYTTGFYTDGGVVAFCSLGLPLLAALLPGGILGLMCPGATLWQDAPPFSPGWC